MKNIKCSKTRCEETEFICEMRNKIQIDIMSVIKKMEKIEEQAWLIVHIYAFCAAFLESAAGDQKTFDFVMSQATKYKNKYLTEINIVH